MPIKIRPHPAIPDHEVLRKIGGGAYGEVWLARGVTGALRAVKVVWREDFEDSRGFEREFEGILKFEPMSRNHPALVNILHVGRSPDGVSFYYYVMEIGDDVATGQDINPIEYEPRTLRADNHQGPGVQWQTADCIDVGLRLAEALDHLHERGLAHRDVKPSNVIFMNGRAKLADIGLVATRGQRTFVGTEGFVPPEGPGSAQADVYSLGKVLYEIVTGKDRLSFPELPEVMPAGTDRKRWLELNRIICDICDPRVSKRKISTAGELAEELRRLQRGKRRRHRGLAAWVTSLILIGFAGWAGWQAVKDKTWLKELMATVKTPVEKLEMRQMKVITIPSVNAEIYDANDVFIGTANVDFLPIAPGAYCDLTLKMPGYRDKRVRQKAPTTLASEPWPLIVEMEVFNPPKPGEPWEDHLRNSFGPVGEDHVGSGFVSKADWARYAKEKKRPGNSAEFLPFSENGNPVTIALATASDANGYCQWYLDLGIKEGFLTKDLEVVSSQESSFENSGLSERARRDGMKPFRLVVRRVDYGEIMVVTDPPGVDVYLSPGSDPNNPGRNMGSTDPSLLITKLRPGTWQLVLYRQGWKERTLKVKLEGGKKLAPKVVNVELEKDSLGVVFGTEWENGIGMKFAPMGPDLMVSIWETRLRDYQLFVKETNHPAARPPDFAQTPDHPVVNVSRQDAQDFCGWLTKRERKDKLINQNYEYRLPTDPEWSSMVGLREDGAYSPAWRDASKKRIYPWGETWLTGSLVVGNFADMTAAAATGASITRTIQGYDDGFAYTSPVGSFPTNSNGLYDISGNVQEWVSDEYSTLVKVPLGVLRGGSWNTYQPESLISGSRRAMSPTDQDAMSGFRVVLCKVPPKGD